MKLYKLVTFIIILSFVFISCIKNDDVKIIFLDDHQKVFIDDIILYSSFSIELINKGNYWTIKNTSEEALLEIIKIAHIKMDVINTNIQNVDNSNQIDGVPYIRRYVKITPESGVEILEDTESDSRLVWDPMHPDAIKTGGRQGYVIYPNIDVTIEMVDLIRTTRLYEAFLEILKNKYKYIII